MAVPPQDYESLARFIADQYPQLSKRLQQIASFALDNPNEMALQTIAEVAKHADVQPSSLIRFAKALGYSGYTEMQRVFRLRLTDALPDYHDRIRALQESSKQVKPAGGILRDFIEADIAALEYLRDHISEESFAGVVETLADADTIYLVAHRRAFPVAAYLSYAMSRMGIRNVLVDSMGGMFFQQASHARRGDCILAISFKAYSLDVVQVCATASEQGVPVVAVTDGPLSPLVAHATHVLETKEAPVHGFRSLAPAMSLAITLLVALGHELERPRRKKGANKAQRKA